MKSLLPLLLLHLLLAAAATGQQRRGGLMGGFIANNGQWPAEACYLWRAPGMDSWLTEKGIVFHRYSIDHNTGQRTGHVVRMEFAGGNATTPLPAGRIATHYNYLIGNNPAAWVTGAEAYQQVRLPNVYDGIDALLYYDGGHDGGELRYDLVVEPGADPSAIRVRFSGGDWVRCADSVLQIGTTVGAIEQSGLVAYQVVGGVRRLVPCAFVQHGDGSVGFRVGDHDPSTPLVIDPLIYSTFIGGTGTENFSGFATDAAGSPIVCGSVTSLAFPTTTGAYSTTNKGLQDVVVARLDSSGGTVLYATYIGGSGSDAASKMEATANGTAWITGSTNSIDFPTTPNGAQQSKAGEQDAFLLALDPTGAAISYATYLGGSAFDEGGGVALDSSGGVVMVGATTSPDFPATPGTYDQTYNDSYHTDLFIARIGSDGGVRFASFLGGEEMDRGYAVATNGAGEIFVTGETASANFPTTATVADNTHNGNADAFLARLDSTGAQLLNSGFIGGEQDDVGYNIAIGPDGNPYLCGSTRSDSFPTTFLSADTVFNGNTDAFVVRFNNDGSRLRYGLYLGGVQGEVAFGIAVDARGSAHVVGGTFSQFFPAGGDVFDPDFNGASDAFVVKLSPFGGERVYSTFLGGFREDYAYGIRLDKHGNATVAGITRSFDFPITPNGADTGFNGNGDFFITKLTIEDETVGVETREQAATTAAGIAIWPNPSLGVFQVSIPPAVAITELRLFNILGTLLMRHRPTASTSALTVDCGRFAAGGYLMELRLSNGTIARLPVMLR
ncbi:MAG: T9SS type A sorting domain-containing protein [Chlorobi bacterium]|nr:T9SS type A sorting domain-containing protein [Chlorobiota bacterium]